MLAKQRLRIFLHNEWENGKHLVSSEMPYSTA